MMVILLMSIALLTKSDFSPFTVEEARSVFASRAALSEAEFNKLTRENKQRAFKLVTVQRARLVQRAKTIIEKAIAEGTDFAEVRRELLAIFDTAGLPRPAESRVRAMFRYNTLHSYNVARQQTLNDPEITAAFPYRQYLTVGNGTPGVNGVRATHAALHGKVFRWDDPFWDHYTPPWEYGCRCTFVALTAGQVRRMGIEVADLDYVRRKIPVPGESKPGIAPHPDFDFPRDAFDAVQFDLERLDEELRVAVERTLAEGEQA